MAKLNAARTSQPVMASEFVFNYGDTMVDVNGVTKSFGSTYGDAGTFEVINMPLGAVIVGGQLIVETQGAGPTAYTCSVGNSSSATAYLAATDLKAAAGTTTELTGIGLGSNDGKNVRITIASTVANASAGKFRVRVMYTIDNRATEVVSS